VPAFFVVAFFTFAAAVAAAPPEAGARFAIVAADARFVAFVAFLTGTDAVRATLTPPLR
jgi:hypothetical protein